MKLEIRDTGFLIKWLMQPGSLLAKSRETTSRGQTDQINQTNQIDETDQIDELGVSKG